LPSEFHEEVPDLSNRVRDGTLVPTRVTGHKVTGPQQEVQGTRQRGSQQGGRSHLVTQQGSGTVNDSGSPRDSGPNKGSRAQAPIIQQGDLQEHPEGPGLRGPQNRGSHGGLRGAPNKTIRRSQGVNKYTNTKGKTEATCSAKNRESSGNHWDHTHGVLRKRGSRGHQKGRNGQKKEDTTRLG